MDHYKLVLPEYNNHYGYLFGGHLLNWIDEFAYITATVSYPGRRFVTVAMENVEFKLAIQTGEVLLFRVELNNQGKTSLTYKVTVYGVAVQSKPDEVLFSTSLTFVNVDEDGNKIPI